MPSSVTSERESPRQRWPPTPPMAAPTSALPELEKAFVKVAKSWCEHSGVSAAALREVGMPARVLAKAGL